jgi:hypothetical protein
MKLREPATHRAQVADQRPADLAGIERIRAVLRQLLQRFAQSAELQKCHGAFLERNRDLTVGEIGLAGFIELREQL